MFKLFGKQKKQKQYDFSLPKNQDAYYTGDNILFRITTDNESTVILFIYDKRGTWLNLIYTIKNGYIDSRDYDSNVYMYGYADKGIINIPHENGDLEINWMLPDNFPTGDYIVKASVFSKDVQKTFTDRITIYSKGRYYGGPTVNMIQGNHLANPHQFDKLTTSY